MKKSFDTLLFLDIVIAGSQPTPLNIMIVWKEITEERYYYLLNVLPPCEERVNTNGRGFLVSEPDNEKTCAICGKYLLTFVGAKEVRGKFYETANDVTKPEWRAWF